MKISKVTDYAALKLYLQPKINKNLLSMIAADTLHHCLLVFSAHNLCKKIGPRSGPTKLSGLIWFQSVCHSDGIPESFFEKVDFEKKSADDKKAEKISQGADLELNS